MSARLLVAQLRFARSEFARCFDGVSEEDAGKHVQTLNCLSWIVGHLANHEHFCWVMIAQGKSLFPGLNDLTGYGKPQSTPSMREMWETWEKVTHAADAYLDSLTPDVLTVQLKWKEKPLHENVGTMLMRNTFHYWLHTGQSVAIRKLLGHEKLPEYVGDMSAVAYRADYAGQ